MPTWPSTVPQKGLIGTFQFEDEDNVDEFPVDVGPPLRVRSSSIAGERMAYSWIFTATQWEALRTFWRTDCADGSLEFQRTHPRTGLTITCVFASKPKGALLHNGYVRGEINLYVMP